MARDVSEELARLAELRDRGVLTGDEFAAQKAAVLKGESVGPATEAAKAQAVSTSKKMGVGCAVIVGILVILMIIGLASGSKPDAAKDAAKGEAAASPPTEVTARALADAYQANEAAAQAAYGDRALLVSGVVDGVDLDLTNQPIVKLKTSNEFLSAQANLTDTSKPKASGLAKGKPIKLLCSGVSEVIGTPILADCEIQ